MFFKKRKEKQLQERNDIRHQTEQKFCDAIAKANTLEDPGEKIATFQTIKKEIDSYLVNDLKVVSTKANKTEKRFSTTGDVALWSSVGAGAVLTGPVGWAIAGVGIAGYMGIEIAGAVRSNSMVKKYKNEVAEHAEKLDALQFTIEKLTNDTIENQIEAIIKSPFYLKLAGNRSLSNAFGRAAEKHVLKMEEAALAAKQEPAAQEEVASPATKEEKKPVYTPRDFSKLNRVLNKKNDPKA